MEINATLVRINEHIGRTRTISVGSGSPFLSKYHAPNLLYDKNGELLDEHELSAPPQRPPTPLDEAFGSRSLLSDSPYFGAVSAGQQEIKVDTEQLQDLTVRLKEASREVSSLGQRLDATSTNLDWETSVRPAIASRLEAATRKVKELGANLESYGETVAFSSEGFIRTDRQITGSGKGLYYDFRQALVLSETDPNFRLPYKIQNDLVCLNPLGQLFGEDNTSTKPIYIRDSLGK